MEQAVETKSVKKAMGGDFGDIYTAMLGLALLVLAAAIGVVCYMGMQNYKTIFTMK